MVLILRVLRHERNLGNPAAQKTLVCAARGEFIFHIGADREWRMSEIHRMRAKLKEGYDIVIGVRRNKQYTLGRKMVSEGFNLLVALLWGRDAQSLAPALADVPTITSAHPSPMSADRGFFGSRPFSRANDLLDELGDTPIDWRLP